MSVYEVNGTGELLGDSFATGRPILCGGNVWFVLSTTGVDAASPAGKDKEKPLATLAQAQTNATDGDVVVLLNGHAETYTAALALTKKLLIVGTGLASGIPGARFTNNSAAAGIFTMSAVGIELRNIYFPTNSQSNSAARIVLSQSDSKLVGCYFECAVNDAGAAAVNHTAGSGVTLENCTFISTATAAASRAPRGFASAAATSELRLRGCIFSDGTVGFSTAACDLGSSVTNVTIENISLLLGADLINIGSSYRISGVTQTGGGRIAT